MRKFIFVLIVLSSITIASEIKVKGIITGADCGLEGMTCNLSHLFTGHELLGIFSAKTKRFYFLTNVPQKLLIYLFGKEVTVEGTKLSSDAIKVYKLKRGSKVIFKKQ